MTSIAAERVRIDLAERSYEILIGAGLLDDARSYEGLPHSRDALLVSDALLAEAELLLEPTDHPVTAVHLVLEAVAARRGRGISGACQPSP